jgi:hypothetical protein
MDMPGPLFTALTSIPWSAILKNAPAIVKAANALLTGTKTRPPTLATADELTELKERVAALEAHDISNAEVLKRLADQLEILTFSTRIVAARARAAWVLGAVGLIAGLSAVALCFIFRF